MPSASSVPGMLRCSMRSRVSERRNLYAVIMSRLQRWPQRTTDERDYLLAWLSSQLAQDRQIRLLELSQRTWIRHRSSSSAETNRPNTSAGAERE